MPNLDTFAAQLVDMVRNMPDEAILDLVRQRLGASTAITRSAPTRAKATTSRTAKPTTARTMSPSRKKPSRKKRSRATPDQLEKLLADVEAVVKKSKGVGMGDVAKAVGIPKSRVAAAIRELKSAKRIYQGGDRRFARYAGDAKTAKAASKKARLGE